ncbi:MAG: hypothetical protein MNSN_01760 [Minisyncoccus archaeiphilus]|uniref:hypothetical protein n=1 Tax=Minisyncoccus archaeiphilus TaxID=3238481 RepID=UPI002B1B83AF|nr:MAG: hypothetical protein MNSN_01760 [Candidatus Parcubacteria bacterium]
MKNIFKALHQKPVAYYPAYAQITGSIKSGILLSQIMFWWSAMDGQDFYKRDEDFATELSMKIKEFRSAKKIIIDLGLVESKLRGSPPITFYRILEDEIIKKLEGIGIVNLPTIGKLKCLKEANQFAYNRQNDLPKIGKSICPKQANPIHIQRIHTENTYIDNIFSIFNFWNEQKIIVHQKLTSKMKNKIGSVLKEFSVEDLKKAIRKYGIILNDEKYYWTYKWTLEEFLQRGLTKFMDTPEKEFLKTNFEKPKKPQPFYRGNPMKQKNGKWYVIEDGEWLEYADKESQIEWLEV